MFCSGPSHCLSNRLLHFHQLPTLHGLTQMTPRLDQLAQLITATADGDLISKDARDSLMASGLVARSFGFNYLTPEGVKTLANLGVLTTNRPSK